MKTLTKSILVANERHRLEDELLKQLDCIGFNENVGKENIDE